MLDAWVGLVWKLDLDMWRKKVIAMFSMDCDYWKTSVVSGLPRAINITTNAGYVRTSSSRSLLAVAIHARPRSSWWRFCFLVQLRLLAWPGLKKVYFWLRRFDVTQQGWACFTGYVYMFSYSYTTSYWQSKQGGTEKVVTARNVSKADKEQYDEQDVGSMLS